MGRQKARWWRGDVAADEVGVLEGDGYTMSAADGGWNASASAHTAMVRQATLGTEARTPHRDRCMLVRVVTSLGVWLGRVRAGADFAGVGKGSVCGGVVMSLGAVVAVAGEGNRAGGNGSNVAALGGVNGL